MAAVKWQQIIFYSLLLGLPINLAKHFFFDFSSAGGIYVDYLVPTFYLTDLWLVTLLVLWGLEAIKSFKFKIPNSIGKIRAFCARPLCRALFLFLLAAGFSIFGARNRPAAVYKWLRFFELSLFSLWVAVRIDLRRDWGKIAAALSVVVFYESLMAVFQWLKQGSLLGFYFLGEQPYNFLTPGVAKTSFFGEIKVRPYGTFPHPNVLGGYLAVLLPWVFSRCLRRLKKPARGGFLGGYWLAVVGLGVAALFLSFSRTAWVAGVLGGLVVGCGRMKKYRKLLAPAAGLLIFSLSFLVFLSFHNSPKPDFSWRRRWELNRIAWAMIGRHPFSGVGLNNFTATMDGYGRVSGFIRFLQPVHNIYLLAAAETGLFGLAAFLWLLTGALRALPRSQVATGGGKLPQIAFFQILFLGLFDHYFLTTQQGSLLFFLAIGLAFSTQSA